MTVNLWNCDCFLYSLLQNVKYATILPKWDNDVRDVFYSKLLDVSCSKITQWKKKSWYMDMCQGNRYCGQNRWSEPSTPTHVLYIISLASKDHTYRNMNCKCLLKERIERMTCVGRWWNLSFLSLLRTTPKKEPEREILGGYDYEWMMGCRDVGVSGGRDA